MRYRGWCEMEMSVAQIERNGERERGKVEWIIGREGRKGDDEERKEMKER